MMNLQAIRVLMVVGLFLSACSSKDDAAPATGRTSADDPLSKEDVGRTGSAGDGYAGDATEAASVEDGAVLVVMDGAERNLGVIAPTNAVTPMVQWRVRNRGSHSVSLRAVTTCGCLGANISPASVGPGQEAVVNATMSRKSAGPFLIQVRVVGVEGPPLELAVRGTVETERQVAILELHQVAAGMEFSVVVDGPDMPVSNPTLRSAATGRPYDLVSAEPWRQLGEDGHRVEQSLGASRLWISRSVFAVRVPNSPFHGAELLRLGDTQVEIDLRAVTVTGRDQASDW